MKKLWAVFCFVLLQNGFRLQTIHQITREDVEFFINHHPYSTRPDSERDHLDEESGEDHPDLAVEQDFLMTLDPALGYPPKERLQPVLETVSRFKNSRTLPGGSVIPWEERGPSNVGGRTRAVMFDPNDVNGKKVWIGGVAGGLWYTNDISNAASAWVKVDDFWDNIAISCITYDLSNTQVFYAGTGEGWFNSDAVRGAGIWKSTDGGSTWNHLSSTSGSDFDYVQKILVDPATGYVYASTKNNGVMRSQNGGTSWSQVLGGGNGAQTDRAADIERGADGKIYASMGIFNTDGVYSSTSGNSGSWTKLNTGGNGFPTSGFERIELATAPNDSTVVYALLQSASTNSVYGVYRTDDEGASWDSLTKPAFPSVQAWYNLIAAVDPNDANSLFVAATYMYKSVTGGTSWNSLFGMHVDNHAIVYKPGSSDEIVFGNDGGVYYTANGSNSSPSFTNRNSGYNVTQFYACAIHPASGQNYFLAGAQDNGTQKFDSPGIDATNSATGNDGTFCFIDQTDPTYQITGYQWASYNRSTNGGSSFSSILSNLNGDYGWFINPADYDDNQDILYAARDYQTIYRVSGISGSVSVDTILISGLNSTATHIRVSPYTVASSTIFVGTSAGRVFKITNTQSSSPSITEITGTLPSRSVSCIEIGSDEDELLVTFSNYGTTSVWYTNDGGTNWVNKEGDLPDMPVRWALFNPLERNEVILATEVGVWSTDNLSLSSPHWEPSNSGLANVRVDMLQYRSSDNTVIAATHGRGLFSGFFSATACPNPYNAEASGITFNSANLSWDTYNSGATYTVEWGTAGYTPGGGAGSIDSATGTSSDSNTVSIADLSPVTDYEFYVQEDCGANGMSERIGPFSFSTAFLVSTFPYCEDFEGFSLCTATCGSPCTLADDWENSSSDSTDWTVNSGGTPSNNTGPSADHTSGLASGKYIYVEATNPCFPNEMAVVYSPVFELASLYQPHLEFWYNMNGSAMGSLTVYVEDTYLSGNWVSLFSKSGNQGTSWQKASVNISDYTSGFVRFRFIGITGSDFTSDIAIDDVCVAGSVCNDSLPPEAHCKDMTLYLDSIGNASVIPSDVDNGSTDDCLIASLSLSKPDFSCNDVGTVTDTLTVNDTSGKSSACISIITVADTFGACYTPPVQLEIKAFLSGPYDAGSGLMNDSLRTAGMIPLDEPYSFVFTHYAPGGGETIDTSVLLVSGNDAIVDWVFIQLRDKSDSSSVVATRSALIQRDGDMVDVDGVSPVSFPGVSFDDYFVSIRHRNHLGVMTSAPLTLSSSPVAVDFTSLITATFGVDAENIMSGKKVMWSGNVFVDGLIKFSGANNDRDKILVKIGGTIPTNVVPGYFPEDVNLDGIVKYSGLNNDSDIILVNIGGAVPTDVIIEQLP